MTPTTTTIPEPALLHQTDQPVRRSARRLRWFIASFISQVDMLSADTRIEYQIDRKKLTNSFFRWLRAFNDQKPDNPDLKFDYVGFAAGLMLRELIRQRPIQAIRLPEDADVDNPAYFWPEGYVYVAYCLNIRKAVLEQEFDVHTDVVPKLNEIRTWWSFKENVAEDPSTAFGFFDLFAGVNPNWVSPAIFKGHQTALTADRYFTLKDMGED